MSIIEFLVILIIFGIAIKGFTSYRLACANEMLIEIERNDSYRLEKIITWIILMVPILVIAAALLFHYN